MTVQNKKTVLINIAYIAVILGIAILVCRKGLSILMPFLIAWLVTVIIRPVIELLIKKCHFSKGLAAAVVSVVFYAVFGFLLTVIGMRLIAMAKTVIVGFPNYYNEKIEPFLIMVTEALLNFAGRLSPEASDVVRDFLMGFSANFESILTNASVTALRWLTTIAIRMPSGLLKVLITIIATVFISSDYPLLKRFVMAQLSERNQMLMREGRAHLVKTVGKYIRSYFLIMVITFAELYIGLKIIGQQRAAMIAALIAVLDILPVVGSGTILIPWTLISIVTQNYSMALKIGVLYLTITIIRNIIEPKIVGDHVGMHPVATLMAMVIGTYVFGPIGLLGLPIAIALFKSLNDEGIIHVFKMPEPDPDEKQDSSEKKQRRPLFRKNKPTEEVLPVSPDIPDQDVKSADSQETEATK